MVESDRMFFVPKQTVLENLLLESSVLHLFAGERRRTKAAIHGWLGVDKGLGKKGLPSLAFGDRQSWSCHRLLKLRQAKRPPIGALQMEGQVTGERLVTEVVQPDAPARSPARHRCLAHTRSEGC